MTTLEIYIYVAPLLVLAVGLAAFGMTVWRDRRSAPEPRPRRPAE
jgi:hypothetical protein